MSLQKTPGEVAALAGYFFQYEIFATEIYNHLLENDLEWVEFASSAAGKLDDVLLGVAEKVIAYQVKQISSSNFSYHEFMHSDTESIFQGLFKGWKIFKNKYPGKVIDARFITTQGVSAHDLITAFAGMQKPSFEKFLANFWLPVQKGTYTSLNLPKVWQPVFDEMLSKLNSTGDELIAFICELKFVFNYNRDQFLYDTYTQAKREAHIGKIARGIAQIVAKKGNVRYDRAQFLREFGLKDQFETRFQHAFFVDEKHYQPINSTLSQLATAIQAKNKGYIALVGNAGSGKSTTLTKWLAESQYKVLKYYAYTNVEMSYEYGYRGEASYFLHDLLIQIRESGASLQDRLPEKDLLDLQMHLGEELKKLSYRDEKVFIIVDGLDHIGREQQVDKSLIEVLPPPSAVPENIYFILGSRTISQLEDLNFEIRQDLTDRGSVVSISPLAKEQINELANSYEIRLGGELLDMLQQNTKGHPLFLRYTIEELKEANVEAYPAIISTKEFSGDIELEYRKFWDKHKTLDEFVHILGLISRFRFPYFDLELLTGFTIKRADAERINKVAEFYFYKSENVWQFFHNSFKEFLIAESAKNHFSGRFDPAVHSSFHAEIADTIAGTKDFYRFNLVYHLFKAGRFLEITQMVSQAFFREQWFAYRNTNIIREDIKLVLRAAMHQSAYHTVVICFFALLEIDQRAANFNFGDYYDIFLSAGRLDLACSFVFDPAKLFVRQTAALEFSRLLAENGYSPLARELFARATPVHLLTGSQTLSRRRYQSQTYTEIDEVELVKTWVDTAVTFQSVDEVLKKIGGIAIGAEGMNEPDEPVLPEIILSLQGYLLEQGDFDKLGELEVWAREGLDDSDKLDFYYDLIYRQPAPEVLKQRALDFFDHCFPRVGQSQLISYSLIYTFVVDDAAKRKIAFERLKTPAEIKAGRQYVQAGGLANYIFNYVRLFYIVTKNFSKPVEDFLPPSDKPAEKAFELAFAKMGQAHAWYFHGYPEASAGFFGSLEKMFSIFHHSYDSPLYDHDIIVGKSRFVEQVLRSSISISPQTTAELLGKLTQEWRMNKRYWSEKTIQNIVSWAIDNKLDTDWCRQTLNWLEEMVYATGYLNQVIEDGATQARLWAKLGSVEQVERCIDRLMSLSLGVGPEEDRQVDQMVSWIGKKQPIVASDIQFYLDRLIQVLKKVNSAAHTPARAIFELSLALGNGFGIFNHLLFNRLLPLLDGLETSLNHLMVRNPQWSLLLMKLFTRIIVTMDDSNSTRRLLIRTIFSLEPGTELLASLVREINIYAVAEVRSNYLAEIYDLCIMKGIPPSIIGISTQPESKDRRQGSPADLRLKDGSSFDKAGVLAIINSIEELLTLRENEVEHGHFNWTEILIKVIPGASEHGLSQFIEGMDLDIDTAHILNIAETLQANGRPKLAESIIERTINNSRYCQWGDHYYAKGKIPAYQKLQKIKPGKEIRSAALKDFIESLPGMGVRDRESIIGDLDQIFDLFAEQLDHEMIYTEINLFRNELLSNELPSQAVEVKGNDDDESLLIQLLFFLITMPSQFENIIFPLLIAENKKMEPVITTLLRRLLDEGFTIKFLHLLQGLGAHDNVFTEVFRDELTGLVNDERADIVLLASGLLHWIGVIPHRTVLKKDLPLSYSLELTPQTGLVDQSKKAVEHISEDGYLKETNDPLVYTHIISYERKILARYTGFKEYNIAYRIRHIGNNMQFPKWCSEINELELRRLYETALDLKIPYNRPQVQQVYDGLGKVIMELCDLRYFELGEVSHLLPHFDPRLFRLEATEMPGNVRSILKLTGGAPSVDRKWAHEMDRSYVSETLPSFDGKHYILAENTILQGMGHGKAMEIREAFIDTEIPMSGSNFTFFPSTTEELIEYYPEIQQAGIVIYNNAFSTGPASHWLAINPSLAYDMGLTLNSKEGNFRWDNPMGEAVIESVFWRLGDTSNKSGHHDSEAGFGWRVQISREGLEDIIAKLDGRQLFHYKKVTRHLEYHQKRYNTNINEEDRKVVVEEFTL